ncbi:hypothetical protein LTR17_008457 [Elasticomyces elasticus]|nr:hypothetical protein LTR17_008457 [Elasticomyces elasticus]
MSLTPPPPEKKAPPSNTLLSGIKELYLSGLYSDFTIVSWNRSFKVHKVVLHTQSSVFRAMLSGNFKEANQNTLTLNHDDPGELAVMLHFFYHSSLPAPSAGTREADPEFMVCVYKMADKYDVPALCALAASTFSKLLKPICDLSNIDSFCVALIAIDEFITDDKFWDIAVPKIVDNMSWLASNDKFCDLLQRMPKLNQKLLVSAAKVLEKAKAPKQQRSLFA